MKTSMYVSFLVFFFQYGFLDASRQADVNRELTEFPREID